MPSPRFARSSAWSATSGREFVVADIPGLIEGAAEGAGIGDRFLGHIERCRVLLHLVDANDDDVATSYRIVRDELDAYGAGLLDKPVVVALNKVDTLDDELIAALSAEAGRGQRRRSRSRSARPARPGSSRCSTGLDRSDGSGATRPRVDERPRRPRRLVADLAERWRLPGQPGSSAGICSTRRWPSRSPGPRPHPPSAAAARRGRMGRRIARRPRRAGPAGRGRRCGDPRRRGDQRPRRGGVRGGQCHRHRRGAGRGARKPGCRASSTSARSPRASRSCRYYGASKARSEALVAASPLSDRDRPPARRLRPRRPRNARDVQDGGARARPASAGRPPVAAPRRRPRPPAARPRRTRRADRHRSSPTTASPAAGPTASSARRSATAVGRKVRIAVDAAAASWRRPPAPTGCCAGAKAKLTPDRAAYFCHPDWVADPANAPSVAPCGRPRSRPRRASPTPPAGTAEAGWL